MTFKRSTTIEANDSILTPWGHLQAIGVGTTKPQWKVMSGENTGNVSYKIGTSKDECICIFPLKDKTDRARIILHGDISLIRGNLSFLENSDSEINQLLQLLANVQLRIIKPEDAKPLILDLAEALHKNFEFTRMHLPSIINFDKIPRTENRAPKPLDVSRAIRMAQILKEKITAQQNTPEPPQPL